MAESTGTIVPPKLDKPEDYRDFMRSEAGSQIKPGSDEEKLILDGFKAARRKEAETQTSEAIGTPHEPGPLAEELRNLEESQGGYVTPEASREAHEITVTKLDGQNGEVPIEAAPGPLEANNNPETGIVDPAIMSAVPQAGSNPSQVPEVSPKAPGVDQPPQRI